MTQSEVEKIVDGVLEDKPDILERRDLAKVLGISYAMVPKIVERDGLPTMTNAEQGSWKRIKVHKPVIRQILIDKYLKED